MEVGEWPRVRIDQEVIVALEGEPVGSYLVRRLESSAIRCPPIFCS